MSSGTQMESTNEEPPFIIDNDDGPSGSTPIESNDIHSSPASPTLEISKGDKPMSSRKKARYGPRALKVRQARPPCYLGKVPLEILAEILSYVASPEDILSLARCAKFFCATLTHENSDFIWKRTRANCQPAPIPDPTPNFTESAYAAFIFDSGPCEICGKKVKMYWSFSLKARLCNKSQCFNKFRKESLCPVKNNHSLLQYQIIIKTIPTCEPLAHISAHAGYVRRTAWEEAKDEFNKERFSRGTAADNYLLKLVARTQRCEAILKHAIVLVLWRNKWMDCNGKVKKHNDTFASDLAARMNWTTFDLLQTKAYYALHHSKTNCLELVTAKDFALILPEVESQMLANLETRTLRMQNRAYQQRREDVASHYDRLKSENQCLPTLLEFRQLPMMKVMQSKPSNDVTGIQGDLKNSQLVKEVLKNDLAIWTERARADMAAILGFPQWKSVNRKKLHPVDRLTARFKCKKCDEAATNHRLKNVESLDFATACSHSCPHLKKKKLAQVRWSAEQFEPDQQVIDTVQNVLALCKTDSEDTESIGLVQDLGARIVCLSCAAPIVFDFQTMLRHCRRHDNVQVYLLSEDDASLMLRAPFELGLAAELLSSSPDVAARRDQKIYGCRHCQQSRLYSELTGTGSREGPSTSGTSQSVKEADSGKKIMDRQAIKTMAMQKKLYTFNGLRSHLQEKHRVTQVGDEDFFPQQDNETHKEDVVVGERT